MLLYSNIDLSIPSDDRSYSQIKIGSLKFFYKNVLLGGRDEILLSGDFFEKENEITFEIKKSIRNGWHDIYGHHKYLTLNSLPKMCRLFKGRYLSWLSIWILIN
jgi:hypothetical protein